MREEGKRMTTAKNIGLRSIEREREREREREKDISIQRESESGVVSTGVTV